MPTGNHTVFVCLILLLVTGGFSSLQAQDITPSSCAEEGWSDLLCFDLHPTPDAIGATGHLVLRRPVTPFGVAVTHDGHQRYRLEATVAGLPDPTTFGPYTAYVAWVTTPRFSPMEKMGEIRSGTLDLGEVAFNQFIVLITAEASADVTTRTGKLVLRGRSPSSRMEAHDLFSMAPMAVFSPAPDTTMGDAMHHHGGDWPMPPMHPAVPMAPGMKTIRPQTTPFLPVPPAGTVIPQAQPRTLISLADGDTLQLEAGYVQRTIRERTVLMYGFNGQYPGPLLYVPQAATIVVAFTNRISLPTAIHWHGLRLDNRFDGVPGLTQEPVASGETFYYTVVFPDAGIYWYHPHHREDIQQDLGLYGNMVVLPADAHYYNPVNREAVWMLDDLLLGEEGLVAYGEGSANYMLMGRFGNLMLVNGEPDYSLTVRQGEVVRFFFTNVANTRTFNLYANGHPMKVVGSDLGKYEQEVWSDHVVIAPAERYIVEVQFNTVGTAVFTNRVQAINHRYAGFFAETDTLAQVIVLEQPVAENHASTHRQLRRNADVIADIDPYRPAFDRPVDHTLTLTLDVEGLPPAVEQMMQSEAVYFNPVEWSGTMPMMNWASTGAEIQWLLRDEQGRENTAIDWHFEVGDLVKLRIINDRESFHAMQHPLHIHGQRFLVLEQDGIRNPNLVWKDTVLLPTGSTTDLLLEVTNPGAWMIHCHIAEHLESGMKMVFRVSH